MTAMLLSVMVLQIMTDKVFQESMYISFKDVQEIFPIIIPRDTDMEDIYGHAGAFKIQCQSLLVA